MKDADCQDCEDPTRDRRDCSARRRRDRDGSNGCVSQHVEQGRDLEKASADSYLKYILGTLQPDTELLEHLCENNRDLTSLQQYWKAPEQASPSTAGKQ